MKNFIFISTVLLILFSVNKGYSQYVVEVSVDQPAALEVNAGSNKSIEEGSSVEIGGNPSVTGGYGDYIYSWTPGSSLNNDTISNPIASPDEDTDYTLTVEDSLKCTSTDKVTVSVTATGFEGINKDKLELYPVPVTNVLNIKLPNGMRGRYKLQLVDLQGKVLTEMFINGSKNSGHRLRVKDIPSGAYFVKISNDENVMTTKIIVK
jgi:hypothetical protein